MRDCVAQEMRRPASARGDSERPGAPGPPSRSGGIAGASPSGMLGSGALADLRRMAHEKLLQEKAVRAAAERLKSPPEDGEVRVCFVSCTIVGNKHKGCWLHVRLFVRLCVRSAL